jgi:hypothetical protein
LEGYTLKVLHEEDDNRIMVLAEYENAMDKGADTESLKYFNDSFSKTL